MLDAINQSKLFYEKNFVQEFISSRDLPGFISSHALFYLEEIERSSDRNLSSIFSFDFIKVIDLSSSVLEEYFKSKTYKKIKVDGIQLWEDISSALKIVRSIIPSIQSAKLNEPLTSEYSAAIKKVISAQQRIRDKAQTTVERNIKILSTNSLTKLINKVQIYKFKLIVDLWSGEILDIQPLTSDVPNIPGTVIIDMNVNKDNKRINMSYKDAPIESDRTLEVGIQYNCVSPLAETIEKYNSKLK